jgi:hypothetical protein
MTVMIDPTSNWGSWEGWGTSLAGRIGDADPSGRRPFLRLVEREARVVTIMTTPGSRVHREDVS